MEQQRIRKARFHRKFFSAEDGSQIEPLSIDRLNYIMFFADREQTEVLAFQLKQLNHYLKLNGYAYFGRNDDM